MKEVKEFIPKENIQKELVKNFKEELKNESFKNLVSKLNVDQNLLLKNRNNLLESSIEYENCQKCPNLLACKNKIKGYAYLPSIKEDELLFCYKECKYNKKLREETAYLKNIYIFDEPKDIKEAKIKNIYKDDQNRFEAIKYIFNFIKDYKEGKINKGLYLYGNFGCGKTYLISAMFNELAHLNIQSAIVFWPEFLRNIKSMIGTSEFNENFEKIKKVPLLLIDDIGAEVVTSFTRDEILAPLMQYRMSEHLPTFFTSNLDINSLEKHFSMTKDKVDEVKARRIIERIKQLTQRVEMISENLRK